MSIPLRRQARVRDRSIGERRHGGDAIICGAQSAHCALIAVGSHALHELNSTMMYDHEVHYKTKDVVMSELPTDNGWAHRNMKHFLLLLVAGMLSYPMLSYCCDMPPTTSVATPVEIRAYFKGQGKSVLTFVGYSAAEYENKPAMMEEAGRVLDNFDPVKTIVNSGATREGIGAVYELAKRKGFATTGIVSVKAREDSTPMSPCVDIVFFVEDETWGGRLPGTDALSPTSSAMVDNSDVMVAIGGGDVAKEEMVAARRAGKTTRFIPADMNHRIAREKAATQGRPPPTDFSSVVGSAL